MFMVLKIQRQCLMIKNEVLICIDATKNLNVNLEPHLCISQKIIIFVEFFIRWLIQLSGQDIFFSAIINLANTVSGQDIFYFLINQWLIQYVVFENFELFITFFIKIVKIRDRHRWKAHVETNLSVPVSYFSDFSEESYVQFFFQKI